MWFQFALLVPVFGAGIAIINKKLIVRTGPFVIIWGTLMASLPFAFFLAAQSKISGADHWFLLAVIGSSLAFALGKLLLLKAISHTDLSRVYPLAALGPVFILLWAYLLPTKEMPSVLALAGLLIVAAGIYLLNIKDLRKGLLQPFRSLFKEKSNILMLAVVVLDSFILIFDKTALRHLASGNGGFVLLVETMLSIVILTPWLCLKEPDFITQIACQWRLFLGLGVLSITANLFYFLALNEGQAALVASVLRTEILLVLFLSVIFLKEKLRLETVLGSVIIVLGTIAIIIASP